MQRFAVIVFAALLAWSPLGCQEPTAPKGHKGEAKTKPTGMRPRPVKAPNARLRPAPDSMGSAARPAPAPAPTQAKQKQSCLSLYRAGLARLSTLLAKVGVNRSLQQLEQEYGLNREDTLRPCMALTSTQRQCVIKQPNPLLAVHACRLPSSLGLRAPRSLMALLRPRPVVVDEATARRQLAGLRGRWLRQDKNGRQVELTIGAAGSASIQHLRSKRPQGAARKSVLSMRQRLQLLQQRAVTLQRNVYFRLNRDTFLLSGNPLHSATLVRNKNSFQLVLARDRVLRLVAGTCEVIDLAHLAAHAATCTWSTHEVTKVPLLSITYSVGRWKQRERFYYVRSHLLAERLYERRYVRR